MINLLYIDATRLMYTHLNTARLDAIPPSLKPPRADSINVYNKQACSEVW